MTGLRLVGPGVPRGRRQPIRRRVTRPTGCGTRAATHRPGRAGSRERRPRWTQEVPYAPSAWPSRCTNALPARPGRPAARDGNGESGVLITVSPCRSRRASIARPPACRTPAVRTRRIVITIAEPAVEKLRPDEPDVSFEGCRIDLLQLLGNAGAHRKILLLAPFRTSTPRARPVRGGIRNRSHDRPEQCSEASARRCGTALDGSQRLGCSYESVLVLHVDTGGAHACSGCNDVTSHLPTCVDTAIAGRRGSGHGVERNTFHPQIPSTHHPVNSVHSSEEMPR